MKSLTVDYIEVVCLVHQIFLQPDYIPDKEHSLCQLQRPITASYYSKCT